MTDQQDFSKLFVGMGVPVPLLGGGQAPYVNLDNAASTPPMQSVLQAVDEFSVFYSSVHRGTGFKSQLSTHFYEEARRLTMAFVGANPVEHVCIFGKNTTEAINKLARRFPFSEDRGVVFVSTLEHHSNDLPWRGVAKVVHIRLTPEGRIDEAYFDEQLRIYAGKVALVAISGASNVTGFISPARRLAEKAHAAGAQILVDCAQLAPHRKVDMLPLEDPAHFDYVTLSAHKMYAPYGCGALIGRRDTFERGTPDMRGGGEVEIVTIEDVVWSEPPERDEAGSPNTIGAIAMAAAEVALTDIGMDVVAEHEADLTRYALTKLAHVKGVHLFGDRDPGTAASRLGVIPLNLDGVSHFLLASILGFEFGIGVRNGCFCAHPYVLHLMDVDHDEATRVRQMILSHDRSEVPGMIRISFGLYNTEDDVDRLLEALTKIQKGEYCGKYVQHIASGEYRPQGWSVDWDDYFTLTRKG